MITRVTDQIQIGDTAACCHADHGVSVVHACKHPCHQAAVGYAGHLPPEHPQYLFVQEDHELTLNMIDPPKPLFPMALFDAFIAFGEAQLEQGRDLLIHCNNGLSRAPSLGLILLARRRQISSRSYAAAMGEFRWLCPTYAPGDGIRRFLEVAWVRLVPSSAVPA